MATSLRFLGTGTAFNDDGRGSQAILVERSAGAPFLVDFGPTALAGLKLAGVPTAALDRLFLTHLHGDHTAGWPFLLLQMAHQECRELPFTVHGPRGCRRNLEQLAELCYQDAVAEPGFDLHYRELAVERAAGLDAGEGIVFDTYPMEHHPTSIAYRFQLDGRRIGISGDTAWNAELEAIASECDTLVLECTSVAPLPVPHISLEQLRLQRGRLSCPRILLVHLTDKVAQELGRDPIAGVVATHDGLRVNA